MEYTIITDKKKIIKRLMDLTGQKSTVDGSYRTKIKVSRNSEYGLPGRELHGGQQHDFIL